MNIGIHSLSLCTLDMHVYIHTLYVNKHIYTNYSDVHVICINLHMYINDANMYKKQNCHTHTRTRTFTRTKCTHA
jgi:hypothetical protein